MRTLNDIIPPSRRKEMGLPPVTPMGRDPLLAQSRPPRFPYLTLGIATVIIAASIGALFYFSSAKVEITPNTVSAAVQGSFTATKSSGSLPFEVITAQKIASQSVKGSGTKTVSSSASGKIMVYNTSGKTQNFVSGTRFATAAGLIFKARTAITIPSGTTAKPGSVQITVYAEKPGAAYNVGPTSFTLPGLAGSPLGSQVYARSTSAMTGGASGNIPTVDAGVEEPTRAALRAALASGLAASLEAQIPSGYELLSGAATTTYEALASAPSETTGMVDVKEQGTITAVIFQNTALAKAIAASTNGLSLENQPLKLISTENLVLVATALPDTGDESFTFTLAGTAPLEYSVDGSRIAAAVAGKTRSAAEVALTNYPEVKRAIITLRPFWRQAFPQDPSSISVVVNEP